MVGHGDWPSGVGVLRQRDAFANRSHFDPTQRNLTPCQKFVCALARAGCSGAAHSTFTFGPFDLGFFAFALTRVGRTFLGKGGEQCFCTSRDVGDGLFKNLTVHLGRCVEPAHLSNKLNGGVANFIVACGRFKVVEEANIATHRDRTLSHRNRACVRIVQVCAAESGPSGGARACYARRR